MECLRDLLNAWNKLWNYAKKHDIMYPLPNRYLATGGGVRMEVIIAFLVTVVGGVACHYAIKWLDSRHDKDNK